jgi:hypothetical protein
MIIQIQLSDAPQAPSASDFEFRISDFDFAPLRIFAPHR